MCAMNQLRLTSPRSLDQVVSKKMAAINTLKRDKEDAEKNEGDGLILQTRQCGNSIKKLIVHLMQLLLLWVRTLFNHSDLYNSL